MTDKKKELVSLKMIPLGPLIDMLIEAYNNGADFIDIIGTSNVKQDFVGVDIKPEYFVKQQRAEHDAYYKDVEEEYDNEECDDNEDRTHKLSEDELNQLGDM